LAYEDSRAARVYKDLLIRPGIASTFTPDEGIVQEWITSFEVISSRVVKF